MVVLVAVGVRPIVDAAGREHDPPRARPSDTDASSSVAGTAAFRRRPGPAAGDDLTATHCDNSRSGVAVTTVQSGANGSGRPRSETAGGASSCCAVRATNRIELDTTFRVSPPRAAGRA